MKMAANMITCVVTKLLTRVIQTCMGTASLCIYIYGSVQDYHVGSHYYVMYIYTYEYTTINSIIYVYDYIYV